MDRPDWVRNGVATTARAVKGTPKRADISCASNTPHTHWRCPVNVTNPNQPVRAA